MEEEVLQKIYKLTNELASQQQNNQDLASNVTFQLSELKSKATLKYSDDQKVQIPNPLSPEERDEVLENLKVRLEKALEEKEATNAKNKNLEYEVKDLQALVKEYELGIELITNKLRIHANATTEGEIRLRREYEALLDAEKGTTAALFIENTILQTQLRKLSKYLREAYKAEASVDSDEQAIIQLKKENKELLELLNVAKIQDNPTTEKSSPVLQVKKTGVVEEFFNE